MGKAVNLLVKDIIWVPEENASNDKQYFDCFAKAQVVERIGNAVELMVLDGPKQGDPMYLDLDHLDYDIMKANDRVENDMTALKHFHELGILHNLKERSLNDEPYTFLGSNILVAVNPLKPVEAPRGSLGRKTAAENPHPYSVAEIAYRQLVFGQGTNNIETAVDQTVIVSGESGAGKSESSKMVVKHLVYRCADLSGDDSLLDRKLLQSNPIFELFGNASTSRNTKSSRFGKFLQLHFKYKKGSSTLIGAKVETYLLERSRITYHAQDESTYHIFYLLINGLSKSEKNKLHLDADFKLLQGKSQEGRRSLVRNKDANKTNPAIALLTPAYSKEQLKELSSSLDTFGMSESISSIYNVVVAILHLSNVEFAEDDTTYSGGSKILRLEPLKHAAQLLGVDVADLKALLREKKIKTFNEVITSLRDPTGAKVACDAVSKELYVRLFEHIVGQVNAALFPESHKKTNTNFIGVLDMFGFEEFALNDFEQLLINFANEALQNTFNQQVYEAEYNLYKSEGLEIDGIGSNNLPTNVGRLELLRGTKQKVGLLGMIDVQAKLPQATDEKLNTAFHKEFNNNPYFPRPQPKYVRSSFIIAHYAGDVRYTVGNFLEKNSDTTPDGLEELFQNSENMVVKSMFSSKTNKANKSTKVLKKKSVSSKFMNQMGSLVKTLDQTRCLFIRCIKPNKDGVRSSSSNWFVDNFVVNQMKSLGILQTTKVLQVGFPTRFSFKTIVNTYSPALPPRALNAWRTLGGSEERRFVVALFEAYAVPKSVYRLGRTKVFFASGMLDTLNEILNQADSMSKSIVKKFRRSFALGLWRKAFVAVQCHNRFLRLLEFIRERNSAVTVLQRKTRKKLLENETKLQVAKLREEQRAKETIAVKQHAKEMKRQAKLLKKHSEDAAFTEHGELLKEKFKQAERYSDELESKSSAAQDVHLRASLYRKQLETDVQMLTKREQLEREKAIRALGSYEAFLLQNERDKTICFESNPSVLTFDRYRYQHEFEELPPPPALVEKPHLESRPSVRKLASLKRISCLYALESRKNANGAKFSCFVRMLQKKETTGGSSKFHRCELEMTSFLITYHPKRAIAPVSVQISSILEQLQVDEETVKLTSKTNEHMWFRFPTAVDCSMWSERIELIIKDIKFEEMEMRKSVARVPLTAAQKAKQRPDRRMTAFFDKETNLAKVTCGECRQSSYLGLPDFKDNAYWCRTCGTELDPPAGFHLLEPKSVLGHQFALSLNASFPVTLQVGPHSKTLTVFSGEFLKRPTFDVKTGEKIYVYSYRCRLEDGKGKDNHWSILHSLDAFGDLSSRLQQEMNGSKLEHRVPILAIPEFTTLDRVEQSVSAFPSVNNFLNDLLQLAKKEKSIFELQAVMSFFSLDSVQAVPCTRKELMDIHDFIDFCRTMVKSSKPPNRKFFVFFRNLMDSYMEQLEVTADDVAVFNSTEAFLINLSNQEKAEMVEIAKEYLQVMKSFLQKFKTQVMDITQEEIDEATDS